MKKIKLLMPILGLSALCGSIMPIVTGCKNSQEAIEITPDGEALTTIVGNAKETYGLFSSNKTIANGETVSVTSTSKKYDVSLYSASANLIKVKFTSKETTPTTDEFKLTFTCKKGESTSWTYELSYAVKYVAGVWIGSEERQKPTDPNTYDASTNTSSYTYSLDINQTIENTTFKVDIDVDSSSTAELVDLSSEVNDGKLNVTVKITGYEYGVDNLLFKLNISCLNSLGEQVYTPITIPDFKLTFVSKSQVISKDAIGFEETSDGVKKLTVDVNKIKEGDNALCLPATDDDGHSYKIVECTFDDEKFSKIQELIIEDISNVTFADNLFEGKNIKILNLSKSNKLAKVGDFTAGASTFKFASKSGNIIWNKDISSNRKHEIKGDLYAYGLTSLDWYEKTIVTDQWELRDAAWSGANIQLANDIILTDTVTFESTYSVIDFHGHIITNEENFYKKLSETILAENKISLISLWNTSLVLLDTTGNNGGIKAKNESEAKEEALYAIWVYSLDAPDNRSTDLYIKNGQYSGNNSVIFTNSRNSSDDIKCNIYITSNSDNNTAPEFMFSNPDYVKNRTGSESEVNYKIDLLTKTNDNNQVNKIKYYISAGKFYSCFEGAQEATSSDTFNPAYCKKHCNSADYDSWLAAGYKSIAHAGTETPYRYFEVTANSK